MLEDQVAYLLQRYLGNYVRGLNKEALKISVWKGDVELTNMQLKPEALNALNLPVKVKAGFLGSVKLKVPWSRLGQDPVIVHLDRIFLLAEPATQVEGSSEDAIEEAKKSRVREMEMKFLERNQQLKSDVNKSWLGSLINTIIGNLKLSVSNIHIRYEDLESNPGHPFAAGVTLEKLIAVTIDDNGKETFVSGGALDRIQKSVELAQIALYLDSDISSWHLDKEWKELLPSEWVQVFRFGTKGGKPADSLVKKHTYILQPVTGNAKYVKSQLNEYADSHQPQQKASVNLDDVTLCLSKDGYRDILKLAENFAAFNRRLKYAHLRPLVPVKNNPILWWKYAYRAVSDMTKKARAPRLVGLEVDRHLVMQPYLVKQRVDQVRDPGNLLGVRMIGSFKPIGVPSVSFARNVLKYAKLRKKYISLYATLLKSDPGRATADDNPEIEVLDRELDIDLILQWRMLAHKFVERSADSAILSKKQQEKRPWWSFGRNKPASKDESENLHFTEEDWDQLNKIIGYKEEDPEQLTIIDEKKDVIHTLLEIHMRHNASKLIDELQESLAALSCESLDCCVKLYPETKVFDVKLGSYQLSSPQGLLAKSATTNNSLLGVFSYKPFDTEVDWSMTAKASPCYMTYLKDPINCVMKFFETDSDVSQKIAAETVAAMQMTIDEVKRAAQQQMNRALKDQLRFLLDLDIAAPKVTIPTDFRPDNIHSTQLLLDLGNLVIRTKGDNEKESTEEMHTFLKFNMVLSDVSAYLVDGNFIWSETHGSRFPNGSPLGGMTLLPVIDRCGVIIKLEQNRLDNPDFPSTRVAVRLPSLGFHFSPARYHRLMQVIQLFQAENNDGSDVLRPWSQADLEGWLSLLVWKGIGNREAVWQQRYICLVGSFLYVLESLDSSTYKQYISIRGKQVLQIPAELVGNVENVLAVCDASRSSTKVVEDATALILKCDDHESRKLWQRRLQGAIYRASESAPISSLSDSSSDAEDSDRVDHSRNGKSVEKLFITGIMDELKLCFYYKNQHDNSFLRVLLADESRLCEFRAIGGQVEVSITENDMLIGTVLRTLEIEDLISSNNFSHPLYLARSFVNDADISAHFQDAKSRELYRDDQTIEGDDKFYEASESLADFVDSPLYSSGNVSSNSSQLGSLSRNLSLKPPSFHRAAGLLPYDNLQSNGKGNEQTDMLDSFVKAQIIIHDKSSPLYDNVDKKIVVTLATLSFFCRRPTILAVMEFVSAINMKDDNSEYSSENSTGVEMKSDNFEEEVGNIRQIAPEAVVKGILGKGKSRVVLNLTLRMARAQIFLMNEKEKKIATLSQDNLLADIKVFPSSFGIKAALGNLKISDDSLPSNHMYYWICDMRNPGGSSFVELAFSSFSVDDDDYGGYEYGLSGQLSEVRIVYLNRFIQEIVSYFTGLVPTNSQGVVKVKDQVTNSEKWFTTSEFEGSPAVKLDISLRNPIILMPRQTNKSDYLKLDIVHITVQNCFQWLHGGKVDINAIHMDTMTIMIEDIKLNVGMGSELGESIIQNIKGVSIVIRRCLRDLLHQLPSTEVSIKMEELKAGLSNKEYQIITECALDNYSESPDIVPPLMDSVSPPVRIENAVVPPVSEPESAAPDGRTWVTTKVYVVIDLVELRLHTGATRDAPLATVQVGGLWFLYNSNVASDGFLSASVGSFTVVDDREGTEEGLRLAIRNSDDINNNLVTSTKWRTSVNDATYNTDVKLVPTMLILDANFSQSSTHMSLFIQRPQLLVALDFLLAVVEFFVPTVGNIMADEDGERSSALILGDAIILDQSVFRQPSLEFSLSPLRPLIVDDERYNLFVYDGQGGTLCLTDEQGRVLSGPSMAAIFYVGNCKKLQFKNVVIKNGRYLDSCIVLGASSSYSALKDDQVYLEEYHHDPCSISTKEIVKRVSSQNTNVRRSVEFTFDFQAIGPELTFYNTSKDVGQSRSMILSNKLLHAQLDLFSRVILKGDAIDMKTKAVGFTMECNGIRILEPFDTTLNYSNASGKTNINLSTSDIYMNFSFSILRLFLAVEEDMMSFLRMTSKKISVVCCEFDKVGTVQNGENSQIFVFWRARAPPGFAVLGDYLTPTDKPPTKGVIAINSNFARVKRPIAFQLVWPKVLVGVASEQATGSSQLEVLRNSKVNCSVWFPVAPKGYVALGCVASEGKDPPLLSSVYCVWASLLTPCSLRDCVTVCCSNMHPSTVALWRVNNSAGTFLPTDLPSGFVYGAYELRHIMFRFLDLARASDTPKADTTVNQDEISQQGAASSGDRFEAVDRFQFIWSNQDSSSRKQFSLWRPVVSPGMVYFGDIAVQGYAPPTTCVILHENGDDDLFRVPLDFQLVGQIKKQKGMESISFWMPQAPPGYVSLGCIASKNLPRPHDFSALRCIRSDMVSSDQFMEESLWDSSNAKHSAEIFSIWTIGSDLGTFIIRGGFKKPPRRFALKLAAPTVPSSSDDTIIDATISNFSAAVFDDLGGLMVPLFNVSLSGLLFNQHGKVNYLSSSVGFSLDSRSYNDKYDAWEPLIEPADIFVRFLYDINAPAASQLRITSKGALNLNASVSNCNMLLQAYSSWNNLSEVHESNKNMEGVATSAYGRGSVIGINQKRAYFIIPRNRLGQDLFVHSTETKGLASTIRMPSGDMKPLKVTVPKNMLNSHTKGKLGDHSRSMVTVLIADAEIPRAEGIFSHQYVVTVNITPSENLPRDSLLIKQSARTRGRIPQRYPESEHEVVNWSELFFFKVDSLDNYMVQLTVSAIGKGDPVGFISAPLLQIAQTVTDDLEQSAYLKKLTWMDVCPAIRGEKEEENDNQKSRVRVRCAMLSLIRQEPENRESSVTRGRSGFIQISPLKEGPWTTVRLNYAAPAAFWRFGNDVVASEVNLKNGDRYVDIRSLATVKNNTDLTLDMRLKLMALDDGMTDLSDPRGFKGIETEGNRIHHDEYFETEVYDKNIGWVGYSSQPKPNNTGTGPYNESAEAPSPREGMDSWHLDKTSVETADGWVYAPDIESLKWPESHDSLKHVNYARQRKWVRRRQNSGDLKPEISLGQLSPGDCVPLPLSVLTHTWQYVLQMRPHNHGSEYSWSSRADKVKNSRRSKEYAGLRVSALMESDELLCCTQLTDSSSSGAQEVWFCVSIQATVLAKDIQSNPIQDWYIEINPPLTLTNFLPCSAEFSVLEMRAGEQLSACTRGTLDPGKPVNVHNIDVKEPVYISLLPQGGWLPVHEAVLLSHPDKVPSKTMSLRSVHSGRIVQLILEQNSDKERSLAAKVVRVYAPYWFSIARCPPLTFRIIDVDGKKYKNTLYLLHYGKKKEVTFQEISHEEFSDGYTIVSALNFNSMGISASLSGEDKFGPVNGLSSLGDMDGSLEITTSDGEGRCVKLFISTKPCAYQSVPTKVISICPFITFTNRVGQNVFIRLSSVDEAKVLRGSDSRAFFLYRQDNGPDKLQVRLEDTKWSYPIQITKEDTVSLVLRTETGSRKFLRAEIRGFEEGSRFIVVFRLGSAMGPIRIENRTSGKRISVRQSAFGDDCWIPVEPLSTSNFCWEDPYGQKFLDTKVNGDDGSAVFKFDLEKTGLCPTGDEEVKIKLQVLEIGNVKVARFSDDGNASVEEHIDAGNNEISDVSMKKQSGLEIITELGVVGVSLVDQTPKESLYLYLERVYMSYSTGYDKGATTRFKLILGYLQLDNQLPLTLMPVLLAPEHSNYLHHPVFKMTLTVSNQNPDGVVVYPRVYARVTECWWRLNIHEPIIWALVDLYNNIRLDQVPQTPTVTQVDPEIRVNLIDISEIRIKVSLETAPAQRPHGVLGVWSPILSAVGNAFKIQIHLRRVMHKDRFMRKSSIIPAIQNRVMRDLIHNPIHLLFSVDILGMASSTLSSLSRGFAELSTDGQFLQLRSKQVRSRRITGVGDGILQGTEALAQGVAFGVTGVVTKPFESARQNGIVGLAHGVGRGFLGVILQPVSGALDFFSMTVGGIGASFSKCLEILNNKTSFQRIRNPRAIHADGIIRNYCEREARGQMILYLAEASQHFGCAEIFKEPSKYAWSDYYEEHFIVPYRRVFLVTNRRAMLLQCQDMDKLDKKPCKIMWDVPWQELMALELAKAGFNCPSHLIFHLKNFQRSENFVRVIKCFVEPDSEELPQAIKICSVVRKMWKAYQADSKCIILRVPSIQKHVYFACSEDDPLESRHVKGSIVRSRELSMSSSSSASEESRFVKHSINFDKIWSSEREPSGRCTLCRKQALDDSGTCSIWRPVRPPGYVFVGDIARVGSHPPNCSAVYCNNDRHFALPVGYDLVWRNCSDDYANPVSIWLPRAPEGFASLGCVAVAAFEEPEPDLVYCVAESLAEQTEFEAQKIWSEPESYPWACHIYQVRSDALHFVAQRQSKDSCDWKPRSVREEPSSQSTQDNPRTI